jgi:hypothetical protein
VPIAQSVFGDPRTVKPRKCFTPRGRERYLKGGGDRRLLRAATQTLFQELPKSFQGPKLNRQLREQSSYGFELK